MRSRTRLAAARRWPSRALLALALPATLAALLLGPAAPAHAAGTVVYVPDTNVNTVSVIDTSTNAITATIPVGNAPTYTAVTPDGSQVFVSNGLGTSVSVISAASDTVTATIPISGEPQQVVIDRAGAFAYVVATNGDVTQIATATDTVTGTVNVGGIPRALAISPDGTTLYVSNWTSSVSVIDTATLTVSSVINTNENQSWAIAVTPDGSQVYVAYNHGINVLKSDVAVISTATGQVTARIPVSPIQDSLEGMAVSPDGASVYVTVGDQEEVAVISTATDTVSATITGLEDPVAVALNAAGTTAWVSQLNAGNGSVAEIDTASDTITGTIPGFQFPFGLSVSTTYYNFTGFLPPVSNEPAVNQAHAGQAIPIRFSLNGDQGLNIFSPGDPAVQQVDCTTGAPLNSATPAVTAGGLGLRYDARSGTYIYAWKTSKAWAGTCQQFILGLNDGSNHTATFQFS